MENVVLPENDETINRLIETFNARLVSWETRTHFQGALGMRVKVAEDQYYDLEPIFTNCPVHKAELEEVRAELFAAALLKLSRETAAELGNAAAKYESEQWMGWVRKHWQKKLKELNA